MTEVPAEASTGYPAECPTNAYALDGFSHVVYIVSTVAGGHGGTEASILPRLRNTERGLRSQSLLVSLNTADNTLFTFHRLIDFRKEGKEIYGRLAMVLRQNNCMISHKCALRAADILKEENAHVKRFLLDAVFSALRASLLNDSDLIPIGMTSFLRPSISTDAQISENTAEHVQKAWEINKVDLQVLSQGQVLVFNTSKKLDYFCAMSNMLEKALADTGELYLDPGILCLAPSGQMARYTDGKVLGETALGLDFSRPGTAQSEHQSPRFQHARQNSWKEQVLIWMAEQGTPGIYLNVEYWVEVEVLMSTEETKEARKEEQDTRTENQETTEDQEARAEDQEARDEEQEDVKVSNTKVEKLTWFRVLWPAQLCFYTQPPQLRSVGPFEITSEDPIAFVQDWLLKSDDRAREIARMGSTTTDDVGGQDSQIVDILDEDSGFGSTPYMHNAFAAGLLPSQMMYPTPPDMPYTQATPGMSSVDGIGMTPADTTKLGSAAVEQQSDIDMLDRMDTGVGTGTYDEDLFEDLPISRFGTAGATDEPDWGFFEQHNTNTGNDNMPSNEIEMENHDSPDKVEEDVNKSTPPTEAAERLQPSQLASTKQLNLHSPQDPKEIASAQMAVQPTQEEDGSMATIDVPYEDPISPHVEAEPQMSKQPPEPEIWKKPAIPPGRGRRRSLYDSSEDLTAATSHDDRYTAKGAFWFDAVSITAPTKANGDPSDIRNSPLDASDQRSPSDESPGSDISSFYEVNDTDLDEKDTGGPKRKWTEYEQYSTSIPVEPTAEELDQIRKDNCEILALLQPVTLDHTWLLGSHAEATRSISNPTVRSSHLAIAAQILVDQLSQTSLSHGDGLILQKRTHTDVRVDSPKVLDSLYGRLEPLTFASLTKANESYSQTEGNRRLQSVERPQLCLNRTDKNLAISSTAIPLWENLNFQSMGGRKDVQSFCIHLASANLETGCGILLERLGETYTSCNLGDHSVGRIAGMSNNGLVSWSDRDDTIPNLEQCCERLGTALARVPPSATNIIIYMILMPETDRSPVPLIEGFCVLFESYMKACNKQDIIELQVQIIPFGFVASPDTLVVHSSEEYLRLAIEVYNRFPPIELEDKRAMCGSAVVLAESPKRRIRFDMGDQASPSSEAGSRYLHVSYSYSQNQRWIVAAWSDERGFKALTMCYPVRGPNGGKSRPRLDIIREIWEVSLDLMAKERRRWRLIVARDGFYEISEINEWATQFNSNSTTSNCSLVLLSVDLTPTLLIQTPAPLLKPPQGLTPQHHLHTYSTPISTPQPSTTSPDHHLTPSSSIPLTAATPRISPSPRSTTQT